MAGWARSSWGESGLFSGGEQTCSHASSRCHARHATPMPAGIMPCPLVHRVVPYASSAKPPPRFFSKSRGFNSQGSCHTTRPQAPTISTDAILCGFRGRMGSESSALSLKTQALQLLRDLCYTCQHLSEQLSSQECFVVYLFHVHPHPPACPPGAPRVRVCLPALRAPRGVPSAALPFECVRVS